MRSSLTFLVLLHLFQLTTFPPISTAQVTIQKPTQPDSLHPQYFLLEEKLKQYQLIANNGGWNQLPIEKDSLKTKDDKNFIAQLTERLEVENYLPKDSMTYNTSFDERLKKAVVNYQKSHGIDTTGFVGPATIKELNIPVSERIRQINKNLERWKLTGLFPPEYILVNVPDYSMTFYQHDSVVMKMKVVVGKKDRQTPVFKSKLTYLVLNPSWNIPQNIIEKDIFEKIKSDPGYLSKNNMVVMAHDSSGKHIQVMPDSVDWYNMDAKQFPFDLIQLPGSNNALGRVKFMFPNQYSVYMHDSPAQNLFLSNAPMYSSGCIRLSNALKLAYFLLEREAWTKAKIENAITSGKTQTVSLKLPTMVLIQYFSCWVESTGSLQFRKDIYGKDN